MIGFRSLFVSLFLALAVSSAQAATLFRGETLDSQMRELQEVPSDVETDAAMGSGMMGMMGSNKALRQCARRCLRPFGESPEAALCYYRCTKRRVGTGMMGTKTCPRCARLLPSSVCSEYKFICTTKLCTCPGRYGGDEKKCSDYLEKNCPCNCPTSWSAVRCSNYQEICFREGGKCTCSSDFGGRQLQDGEEGDNDGGEDEQGEIEDSAINTCRRYKQLCRKAMSQGMMSSGMMKGMM